MYNLVLPRDIRYAISSEDFLKSFLEKVEIGNERSYESAFEETCVDRNRDDVLRFYENLPWNESDPFH